MSHHDEYRYWPFLTQEEFELACAYFDQKYITACLGPSRRTFKVRLRRTLTTGNSFIEILRLLQPPDDPDDLSAAFEKLGSAEAKTEQDVKMSMADENDDEVLLPPRNIKVTDALPQYSLYSHQSYVTYEIHLHPTYRVPTLWFSLHDLPMGESTFDLDAVYRYLIPDAYKSHLRAAGFTGGISAAPHPITDIPSFFVHPCQTKEAMESFDCPIADYLMIWIGLTGGCIGLWVPSQMAQQTI